MFTCAGGVLFALVSGQPMMITGATGPLLLLDQSLADFCHSYGFDFLAARMYAGLWMVIIALCVASVEGSVAVKKITRYLPLLLIQLLGPFSTNIRSPFTAVPPCRPALHAEP